MRTTTIAVLLGCLAATFVMAQGADASQDVAGWPETDVAGLARELLEIINGHDESRALEFIEEHYDRDAWADMPPPVLAAWVTDVGKAHQHLEFAATRRAADRPDPRSVVVIMRSRAREQWMGMSLTLGDNDKVTGMVIMPAGAPSTAANASLTVEAFAMDLDAYVTRMTEADRFAGSVLVARGGTVLFEKAYGEASRSFSVANRTDTRFNLGSMNKMFTAVAIAQLAERGQLSLDDPIGKHLPDGWIDPGIGDIVRVRHLLTHTSGLGDYLGDDRFWKASRLEFKEIEDYKPLFQGLALQFEPGSDWAYSNSGFFLLGVIVGQVSGQPYETFLEGNVYAVAGMRDTRFYELDRPVKNLAVGYYHEENDDGDSEVFNNVFLHVVKGGPAGGGYSTVRDLLAFADALRGDALLSPASKKTLWTATEASKTRLPYGAGFVIGGREGDRRVGHGGGFPGVSADLTVHLDTGWTIAVLCNLSDGVGAAGLTAKIGEYLGRIEDPAAAVVP